MTGLCVSEVCVSELSAKVHVTKYHACHAKMAASRNPARHQYQPNAVSNTPATESQSPCHPQTTPERASDPLESLKWRTCHAKIATSRNPARRQYQPNAASPANSKHRAPSATPATQIPSIEPRSPSTTPHDPRAYITPPWTAPSHANSKHKAPSAMPSTQIPSIQSEVPRLPRKFQAQSPGAQARHQTTPGRTSRPLESLKCRACHANSTHRAPEPKQPRNDTRRRQSVHQAPWRA